MVRLFHHYLTPRKTAFVVAEGVALVLVSAVTILLVAGAWTWARALVVAGAFASSLYLGDMYDLRRAVGDRDEGRRLLSSLGAGALVLGVGSLVALVAVRNGVAATRDLVLAAVGGTLAVLGVRAVLPATFGAPGRVLIYGVGARAAQLARDLEREADGLYQVVGFISPGGEVPNAPVPAPLVLQGSVPKIARDARADTVVVSMEDRRAALDVDELLACRMSGVEVLDDASVAEALLKRIPLALVRPSSLIFDDGFRVGPATRLAKRAVDLLVCGVLAVTLAPVMLLVACAIRVLDGSPVLYSQERIGERGRPYRIWKFRTMTRDAERAGAVWAAARDPRVFPIGRFLRRARLDELPQLWNVLVGHMSVVGPRPERPEFVGQLREVYPLFALREEVKPGLTGWAQVRYGYGATIAEQGRKLEYDLYYIKNMSLFLDIVCLLHTAKTVILGRGAR